MHVLSSINFIEMKVALRFVKLPFFPEEDRRKSETKLKFMFPLLDFLKKATFF